MALTGNTYQLLWKKYEDEVEFLSLENFIIQRSSPFSELVVDFAGLCVDRQWRLDLAPRAHPTRPGWISCGARASVATPRAAVAGMDLCDEAFAE